MVLLSHLEAYVGHFTQEQLRTVILPQVSRGGGSGAPPGRAGGRWHQPAAKRGAVLRGPAAAVRCEAWIHAAASQCQACGLHLSKALSLLILWGEEKRPCGML